MDLITHIPGVANSALFTPGANTPSPWNVPITGATDGNSPASATRNMADIYNRVLFALDALVQASGLPLDHANWAQVIDALRSNGLTYAAGAGTANAHTVAYVPRVVALTDGMLLSFKAAAANTGATTLNVSGLGAKAVLGGGGLPLQGGEIVAAGKCMVFWVADLDSFVLLGCSGAAVQVASATQSQHAPQFGQVLSQYGTRGLVGANNVGTPSTQFDFKADMVALRNPTTGATAVVKNVATITNNILTAGPAANGRDQAGAFIASSWVHYYFILNPATGAAQTISSASAPPTGPTLPNGYTAWAYIGAVYLSAGSVLAGGCFRGSWFHYKSSPFIINGGTAGTRTAISLTTVVPPNALLHKTRVTAMAVTANGSGTYAANVTLEAESGSTVFQAGLAGTGGANFSQQNSGQVGILPNIAQTIYYYMSFTVGSAPAATLVLDGYSIPNGGE